MIEAVAAGQVAVSAASRIATLPAPQQQEVLAGIQRGVKPKQALAQVRDEAQQACGPDDAGKPLPQQAVPAFRQRKELRALCRQMDALSREVARLGDSPVGFFLDGPRVQNQLREAKQAVWAAQPAHVCPTCQGGDSGCVLCRGQGWVTVAMHDGPPPISGSAA